MRADVQICGTPIPDHLSSWGSGKEMLYRCPKCSQLFNIYGNLENYCHNCGQKLYWENSPRYVNEEFLNAYTSAYNRVHDFSTDKSVRRIAEKDLNNLLQQFYEGQFR